MLLPPIPLNKHPYIIIHNIHLSLQTLQEGEREREMSSKNDGKNMMMVRGGESAGGPCGACRYLRRKCVRSCIFAPYFVSDQLGTSHFAALHKVFGASNASKILVKIPPHKRRDAVVSLCYEALSRVSDPVYGCVSHIFTLQQQVDDLQAELAYIQARISIIRCPPVLLPPPFDLQSSSEMQASHIKKSQQLAHSQSEQTSFEMTSIPNPIEDKHEDDDDDLQRLARELVAKYLPGFKFSSGD